MSLALERVSTGVAGLDMILCGGLGRNALVFIVGPPGAGKTILATQILFAAVRAGTPGIILTAFSEDHSKLLAHLRPLSFFDSQVVGTQLQLFTLGSLIGPDGQLDTSLVIQTIRQTGAGIVMIDGFQGIPELFVEPIVVRRLLDSLGKLAQMLRITVLVTMEGDARDPQHGAALTMADTVIDLNYHVAGWRHIRQLDLVKQRGHPSLHGLHTYAITGNGLVVYPRLEAQLPPLPIAHRDERLPFGLPPLDAILAGGLSSGSAALLAAAPGAGKTTLALRWALADARPNAGTIVLTFHANPAQLAAKASVFGLDLSAAMESGACTVLYMPPVAIDPDAVAARLLAALRPNTRRVVIDDLGGLIWELGPRARDYLAALSIHLAHAGVTTLFLLETGADRMFAHDTTYTLIAPIAETVLILEEQLAGDRPQHVVRVLTMRFGAYTARQRMVILEQGGAAPPGEDN